MSYLRKAGAAYPLTIILLCALAHGSGEISISEISILVTDQTGAVIPNAELKFKSNSTMVTNTTMRNGRVVLQLPFDRYFVSVASKGFETARIPDFEARGSKAELKVVLRVGSSYPYYSSGSSEVPLEPARLPEQLLRER